MGCVKEMLQAARAVRDARKHGVTEDLVLVPARELWEDKLWLSKRDYENQLMQRCIIGTTMGGGDGSICRYCQEHAEGACDKDAHMKKGCTEWWLRFLTKEEDKLCEQRTAAAFYEKPTEDDQGKDGSGEDQRPDEERDNPGGSGEGVSEGEA